MENDTKYTADMFIVYAVLIILNDACKLKIVFDLCFVSDLETDKHERKIIAIQKLYSLNEVTDE